MLDTKIVGGTIVDGSGKPGFRGNVGIKNGRIAAIGSVSEDAHQTIDAAGRVVCPGFIDVHTHYDAQAFWDPTLSPSCYHGVTTVVGGFCGFSIAPVSSASVDYIKSMLARVEGMPLQTLEAAVPWNWSTFGDFLARLEGRVGLNAGFFVGHSAIRRFVMGTRAVGQKATRAEIDAMKAVLDASLAEGALGFSSTVSATHNDGDGNPVPSRWADRSELLELARVVRRHEGTGLELLPDLDFPPETIDLMTEFSLAGNRPVNWNMLIVDANAADRVNRQLAVSSYARERGGEVIALTVPTTPELFMSLRSGFVFDALPGSWREVFQLPLLERIEKFKSTELRRQLASDASSVPTTAILAPIAQLAGYKVVSTRSATNKKYEGRTIEAISAEEGKAAIDALIDIAIADELSTIFSPPSGGHDRATFELRGRVWADDRTIIGASDAGAHLDFIDTFAFSTALLQKGVREHRVISLEQAIHQLTQRPATYFGLVKRGRIAQGMHADVVIFDPATVGRGPTYQRFDVPGGTDFRLYADAIGIEHVLVNGVRIVADGVHTGRLPGKVLRSGEDSRTVRLDALQDRNDAEAA